VSRAFLTSLRLYRCRHRSRGNLPPRAAAGRELHVGGPGKPWAGARIGTNYCPAENWLASSRVALAPPDGRRRAGVRPGRARPTSPCRTVLSRRCASRRQAAPRRVSSPRQSRLALAGHSLPDCTNRRLASPRTEGAFARLARL
jgi:hypothetical protein